VKQYWGQKGPTSERGAFEDQKREVISGGSAALEKLWVHLRLWGEFRKSCEAGKRSGAGEISALDKKKEEESEEKKKSHGKGKRRATVDGGNSSEGKDLFSGVGRRSRRDQGGEISPFPGEQK